MNASQRYAVGLMAAKYSRVAVWFHGRGGSLIATGRYWLQIGG